MSYELLITILSFKIYFKNNKLTRDSHFLVDLINTTHSSFLTSIISGNNFLPLFEVERIYKEILVVMTKNTLPTNYEWLEVYTYTYTLLLFDSKYLICVKK